MNRIRVSLSGLPLRIRLVAGFSAATFVVLVAAGGFVYWRVEYALDRGLDAEMIQAAASLAPLVHPDAGVSDRSTADATGVAWQLIDSRGTVRDRGPQAGSTGMVSRRQLATVSSRPRTFNVGALLPAARAPYRIRVARVSSSPGLYLLVGVRRDHRDEALRELLLQLTLAGLGTLFITALVGERLARAALRPVERYRRRAAEIATGSAELRLDVPTDRDDEVTRLGHTFNDMLATLEAALDHERHFVDQASHELRTPITLLSSRIQLTRRRRRSTGDYERILDELQVDVDRLADLANQLLDLGEANGSGQQGPGDVAAVAARVVERRDVASPGAAGEVTLSLAARPAPVTLADLDIGRILNNLLDNARTHGRPPFILEVSEPETGFARVVVSDAGPGMSPELLQSATQRFSRSGAARALPGAGLGLALVQELVARAHGELRLCHDGRHVSHVRPLPPPCAHGPEMTVSVILPTVGPPEPDSADP